MVKKVSLAIAALLLVVGCATGRNVKSDDLNAKVDNLQNQLNMKNKEIGMLSDEVRSLKGQVDAAHQAKANAESRLDEALNKLGGKGGSGYDKGSGEYVK